MRVFVIPCVVLLVTSACLSSFAAVIHLKNGDVIYADEVEESASTVHYQIGDNTFTIPKSKVLSVDSSPQEGRAQETAKASRARA